MIVKDAGSTVIPAPDEPVIDRASDSPAKSSSVVDRENVPDTDDPPAAIVTSNVSCPAGIE